MNRVSKILIGAFLFSYLSFTQMGCSTTEEEKNDPSVIFNQAQSDIENDRYLLALEKFRIVKNRFPYSKYSVLAQLRMADVYFLQESYYEAASAYELFQELHPKHEKIAYAVFRTGESYYQAIPDKIERDIASASKALEAFQGFLRKFSTDERAPKARGRVKQIKNVLAQKELYVANFYFNNDKYDSAGTRYKKILKLYGESYPAKEAREKLQEIQKKELQGED